MGGGCSRHKSGRKAQRAIRELTQGGLKKIPNDPLEEKFTALEQMHAKLNGIEGYIKELRTPPPRAPLEKLQKSFAKPDIRQSALITHLGDILKDSETHKVHLKNVELLLKQSKDKFDGVKSRMNDRRRAWEEREHYRDKVQRKATSKVTDPESLAQGTTSDAKKHTTAEEYYDVQDRAATEAMQSFTVEHQDCEISKMMSEICLYYEQLSMEASRRVQQFHDLSTELQLHSLSEPRPFEYWKPALWNSGVMDFIPVSEREALALSDMCDMAKRDVTFDVKHNALKFSRAWRVENFNLWKKYETEKGTIRSQVQELKKGLVPVITLKKDFSEASERLNPELDKDVNEVYLAHGTNPQTLMEILQNGLNERFSGGLFGQGSYLAEDFAKCDKYCKVVDMEYDEDGDLKALHGKIFGTKSDHGGELTYIILCRAALGCFVCTKDGTNKLSGTGTIWSKANRELALIEGAEKTGIHYHALLAETGGTIQRFREFVFFHGARVYPEYLIALQRVDRTDLD